MTRTRRAIAMHHAEPSGAPQRCMSAGTIFGPEPTVAVTMRSHTPLERAQIPADTEAGLAIALELPVPRHRAKTTLERRGSMRACAGQGVWRARGHRGGFSS